MTKLLDKKTRKEVDIAPDAVSAAIDSGQFAFSDKRGVPVNYDGQFMYVKPEYAARHRDRLFFVNEGDVEQRQAEKRFEGIGGAAQALAYGAAKGLSLGTLPALGAAVSPEFAEYSKQIELGRPGLVTTGELGSLAVDPFAAAGKALGLGAKAARGAEEAAVATKAVSRAPAAMEATYEVERAVPALGAGPVSAPPLRLGGRVASAEPEAGAGFAAREAARKPPALPPAGREPIAAPESPFTYKAPPFESQVMTDLRLGRADTADRLASLDQTIQSTLGSKAKGAKKSVRGLQEERAGLARQLEEYDFQLAKYEAPEAEALASQAERAKEATKFRVEPVAPKAKAWSPSASTAVREMKTWQSGVRSEGLDWADELFSASTTSSKAFDDALAQGAENLSAHGMAKGSPAQALESIVSMLQKGTSAERGGGGLFTAPLAVDASKAADLTALGVEGGTAYRSGPFILVAKPGAELSGKLEGLGAVLVNPALGEVAEAAVRRELKAIRPDLLVASYNDAAKVTGALNRGAGGVAERLAAAEARPGLSAVMGEVGAAAPEMKLGERAAAEAEQARQRLRMGGGAPERIGPEPGPLALGGERGMTATERVPGALEAEFTENVAAAPMREAFIEPPAAAQAPQGRGFAIPKDVASMAAQGGAYNASEEARRQATGESEGGLGAILGAGAMGAAVPAAMMLGGKALAKGAGAAKGAALGGEAGPLAQRFAKAAGSVEDAHILRTFGISPKQVERLNAQFTEAGAGKKGVSNFADFIKREVSNIEELKAHLPDNEILQSIPTDKPLKFGQLTPERRTAIAEAVKAKLGEQYDSILTPELTSLSISQNALRQILADVEATAVKGLGKTQFKTIAPELNAFRRSISKGEEMTVGELRQMRKTLDDVFAARNGGPDKMFTQAQSTFRNAVDDAIFSTLEQAAPGTTDAIRALNREYTMASILDRGARTAETKSATTSPIGRDLLAQVALGIAIGNPVGAAMFFVGSVAMRGIYNSRGEGIIADLAGKAERAALRIHQNPVQAAQQASTAIIDSRRPMLLGSAAAMLTKTEPKDYMALTQAVKGLQQSREQTRAEMQRSIAHLPPDEQQKVIERFDNTINALASEMPKGLALEKSLSEQERRYMVFARSVLDPAYATQVLVNGGPDSESAAKALQSLGPQGQQYLQSLADDLRDKINSSEKLRGNEQLQQVYRNVKSKASISIGGGRARTGLLHASAGQGKAGLSPSPMVSPTTAKNMAAALTGMSQPIR